MPEASYFSAFNRVYARAVTSTFKEAKKAKKQTSRRRFTGPAANGPDYVYVEIFTRKHGGNFDKAEMTMKEAYTMEHGLTFMSK